MIKKLTRRALHGVWAALIIPWDDHDELDEQRFVREVAAYADTDVDGVYTGGTTGEFYAMDDETFRRVTRIACHQAHAAQLPVQIGCTALSTRTAAQRIRIAKEFHADAVQIALPFWLKLADVEVRTFLQDLVNVAEGTPIILYLTDRSKRRLEPQLLGELAAAHPTLLGTKDTTCTVTELRQMLALTPDLAIFGGDNDLLTKIPAGGAGGYCSVTGLHAPSVVEYYRRCAGGRLAEAQVLHEQIARMMDLFVRWETEDGLMDSAGDRILRVAGGVDVGLKCQGPYRSGSQRHVRELLELCRSEAPDFVPQAKNVA
jgi:dihydrodipicolinate synthase/N-acetylneuraminate lyase